MQALNIVALLLFLVALAATLVLLRRVNRRKSPRIEPRCRFCGTPGHRVEGFLCPGCRHDVREHGLMLPSSQTSLVGAGWVLAWGIGFLLVVGGVSEWARDIGMRQVRRGFAQSTYTGDQSPVAETLTTWQSVSNDEGAWEERGLADLITVDGRLYSLDIASEPPVARVLNSNGQVLAGPMPFDKAAVERWVEFSGTDPGSGVGQSLVDKLVVDLENSRRPGHAAPRSRPAGARPPEHLNFSGSGGGGQSRIPVEWIRSWPLIGWSLLWMLLLAALAIVAPWSRPFNLPHFIGGARRLVSPCCGHCGYSAVGLERMICPECGSDLRTAGILGAWPPAVSGWRILVLILFTIALLLLRSLATPAVVAQIPVTRTYMTTTVFNSPRSGVFMQAMITAGGGWSGVDPQVLPVTLLLIVAPGTTGEMTLDLREKAITAGRNAPAVPLEGEFSSEQVLKWMSSLGIDVTRTQVQAEAGALAMYMQKAARSLVISPMPTGPGESWTQRGAVPGPMFGSSSMAASDTPRRIEARWIDIIWLPVWIAGLWWIYRLRSTGTTSPAEPQQAAAPEQ